MQIQVKQPVVVAMPLDETTDDVVRAATELARNLETGLVPVHALRPWPLPTARRSAEEADRARERLRDHLRAAVSAGVPVVEPILGESAPAALVLDVAIQTHAQMIVVGQGSGPTVAKWLLGTVADRVVRAARCPVFVTRGTLPGPAQPIVCPVDMSPHSRLGLEEALRMARLFGAPLRVVTVYPAPEGQNLEALTASAIALDAAKRAELGKLLSQHDTEGVEIELRARTGSPSEAIVEEGDRGALVVLASRAFDMLVPITLGDVTSRVLRHTHASVLAIRDLDEAPEERERRIARVTTLRQDARQAVARGELDLAEQLLRLAASLQPGLASIEEELGDVLVREGKDEEGERYHALATILRRAHA